MVQVKEIGSGASQRELREKVLDSAREIDALESKRRFQFDHV
jgi:hypothetical protein